LFLIEKYKRKLHFLLAYSQANSRGSRAIVSFLIIKCLIVGCHFQSPEVGRADKMEKEKREKRKEKRGKRKEERGKRKEKSWGGQ